MHRGCSLGALLRELGGWQAEVDELFTGWHSPGRTGGHLPHEAGGAVVGKAPGGVSGCPSASAWHPSSYSTTLLLEDRLSVLFAAVSTAPINDQMLNQ